MPKKRTNELIRCIHFSWRFANRDGTWYADGRSNTPDAGRHSLGTEDRADALRSLAELDQLKAEDLGLVPRSQLQPAASTQAFLSLPEGRRLYEQHNGRSRVTGGVRGSTAKRYRTVFDKFTKFATTKGVTVWNGVSADLLNAYAADLECKGHAHKTVHNELTTLKQAMKWLIVAGHLIGMKPIELKLRRAESEAAYCYTAHEVGAMVNHCRAKTELSWLGDVIIGLARWSDIDLANERLTLTDETGRSRRGNHQRRELKSGQSRSFPLHPDFLEVLRQLNQVDRYVFHGPRGGRLKPDTARRVLQREVIEPLADRFPAPEGAKGFSSGRLHSFRHAFCSTCANSGVPERMVMAWLGHHDSEMIRTYYHLHDQQSRREMSRLDFLGGAGGCSAGADHQVDNKEVVEPKS
jgi:site-specific recombinase XerD